MSHEKNLSQLPMLYFGFTQSGIENSPFKNKIVSEVSIDQDLFPSNPAFENAFESVLENSPIKDRIMETLKEPPIYGILWKDGHWAADYVRLFTAVVKECKDQGICDHGWSHRVAVVKNMFTIAAMLNQGIYRDGTDILPKGAFSMEYSDSDLISFVLWHDLEYGFDSFDWKGKYDESHLTREDTKMGDYLASYVEEVLPKKIDATDQRSRLSLMRLQKLLPVFKKTVDISSETALQEIAILLKNHTVSPEIVLPYAFKEADVSDYYRDSRLEGVARPSMYSLNEYFFHGDMVLSYEILYDHSSLVYKVDLKKNYRIPTESGDKEMTPDEWVEKISKKSNIQLGCKLARLTGREFIIQF